MYIFQKIQNVLKPNAKAVIQTITMTEDYFEGYDKWPDFIQTYIFPGGELASDQLFIDEANKFDLGNINLQTPGQTSSFGYFNKVQRVGVKKYMNILSLKILSQL